MREAVGESIRVRGLVQGVGFRPTVWRLARKCGLLGDVRNDGSGVLVRLHGPPAAIEAFCVALRAECPPLARIDGMDRTPLGEAPGGDGFVIVPSDGGEVHTGIVPDAASCEACLQEISDPSDRRHRYPFTNCTHCGPRLSIVRSIPYDRANTSMAPFLMCPDCRAEYEDPVDRRFHAQPNACPVCGPRCWLEDAHGKPVMFDGEDAIATASRLLHEGAIVAVKGIGGFHLACDARNVQAVSTLRQRKRRYHKPFALMARDVELARRYCVCDDAARGLLESPAAPIVLLDVHGEERLAPDIAPGQASLGFMLPYSPLHHLLLADWDGPLVMTSGNLSDEPQCTGNAEVASRLPGLADYVLLHDREIVNRVDDSVVRLMAGKPRPLRRARGYAPSPIVLPPGFDGAPPLIALGGELKNTLCLLRDSQAIVSQHLGDLEEALTADAFEQAIELYMQVFGHRPRAVAVDLHPDYRSTRAGQALAQREGLELVGVQHHFAHVASVLADRGRALDAPPVLGIALDGLGYGEDGTIWGGEFLLADYRAYRRLAHLKPVGMPGGTRAILEPWRNTFAQLWTHFGWEQVTRRWPDVAAVQQLAAHPVDVLSSMLERRLNSPLTSSAGRLFDGVAAALGLSAAQVTYEGQAAIELETLARTAPTPGKGYGFAVSEQAGVSVIDPAPMWEGLLDDLEAGVPAATVAARFHTGLGDAIIELAVALAGREGLSTVALSGGVFQNRTLFERVHAGLQASGLEVLAHEQVPTNDGGLSLGQAVVAAARYL